MEKARVVCAREKIGNKIRTWYCDDGYVCAGGNKCKPGPEMQRRLDAERQRAREALQRRLQAIEAQQRRLRQHTRRLMQMARRPRDDGRQVRGYNGDPRAIRSNCSTISGLGGAAPAAPCVTSSRGSFRVQPPRPRAQPSAATTALHRKIYQNAPPGIAPPGTIAVLAAATSDADWIEKFFLGRKAPPPAPAPTQTATATATAIATPVPAQGAVPFMLCPGLNKNTSTISGLPGDSGRPSGAAGQAAAPERHPCLQKAKWSRSEPYNHGPDDLTINPFFGPRVFIKPGQEVWSVPDDSIPGRRRLEGRPWDNEPESGSGTCTELNVRAPRREFRVRMDCEMERQAQSLKEYHERENHYLDRSACRPPSTYKPNSGWESRSAAYWKTHRSEPTGWCLHPARGSDPRPVKQEGWRSAQQCKDDPNAPPVTVNKRGVLGCPQ